jgi:hypothetical protein
MHLYSATAKVLTASVLAGKYARRSCSKRLMMNMRTDWWNYLKNWEVEVGV